MKLKIGDRVAVYVTFNGRPIRSVGQVTFNHEDGTVNVFLEEKYRILANAVITPHEKQCRKLRKSQRREYWIGTSDQIGPVIRCTKPPDLENYIHVKEVKK